MNHAKKIIVLIMFLFITLSCSSVSDKSAELMNELVEALKPVYLKAKRLSERKKFTRNKKAEYIKKFNEIFNKKLNARLNDYVRLMKEFRELDDKAKMNESVEFNNSYYDASGDYDEEEEEENSGIMTNISFYELLTEHRTLVTIESEFFDELKKKITLKKFEAIILRELLKSYSGGDFNSYITRTIDNILTNMLMQRLSQYKKQQEKQLEKMKSFMKPEKFDKIVEERALKVIEKTKGLMGVFVKRYIKKDLEAKLGENFLKMPASKIKNTCRALIAKCDNFVKEKTPIYEKEKKSLMAYKQVYRKEFPRLENLIKRWKKLNPIFSYANQTRSMQ